MHTHNWITLLYSWNYHNIVINYTLMKKVSVWKWTEDFHGISQRSKVFLFHTESYKVNDGWDGP